MSAEIGKKRRGLGVIAAGMLTIGLLTLPQTASAQCTPLTSGVCRPETSIPRNYSFTQGLNYWAVVGVIPTNWDDRDIHVYASCGTGTELGSSSGIDGIDFVVSDFNHTPFGTYYPQARYGSPSTFYNVYWRNGGLICPMGSIVDGQLGGSGSGCNMVQIWDLFLEQGWQYRFAFQAGAGMDAYGALFRNPSASAYWAGRSARVLDILPDVSADYTAPATDWYGLVVYPKWNLTSAGDFRVHVERLNDCVTLSPGVCVNNKLYTTATGPANDYTCTQQEHHWSAAVLMPDALDDKALGVFGTCDGDYYRAQSDAAGAGGAEVVAGDYNHEWLGEFHPRIIGGAADLDYSIQWDDGADIFPVPGMTSGQMAGLEAGSVCVKVWDVYLEAGKQYEVFFWNSGPKEPHVALFRNPTTAGYWVDKGGAEWDLGAEGYHAFTVPATDWYGLVLYANKRDTQLSTYIVHIEPLNDCEPLTSMVCETRTGLPRDFSFTRATPYWAAVALLPSTGDHRGLGVFTQCDGKGNFLKYSENDDNSLIVGDFNHTPIGTYYARNPEGGSTLPYTVSCDTGNETFPLDVAVEGTVGGTTGECGVVRIWDVLLNAGTAYRIGFTRSGAADVRLALFRNPGSGTYWAERFDEVWEYSASGNYTYTAPAYDWYGLVVFPNVRNKVGTYSIRISNASATGIDPEPFVPTQFALYQNAPNPFNPTTTIRYDVPSGSAHVTLSICDVSGRVVRTLVDRSETSGTHTVEWDGKDVVGENVSTGVYFYRLNAGSFTETKKMVFLK